MKSTIALLITFFLNVSALPVSALCNPDGNSIRFVTNDTVKLQNPVSVAYLKKNLRKSSPKLVLTPAIERNLKKKISTDLIAKNYYGAIKLNAQQIQKEPLLTRQMQGRRLLAVSREMLYRMNILAMVYRIE